MKKLFVSVLLLALVACQQNNSSSSQNAPLTTANDSLNYSLGVEIGKNLKPIAEDIQVDRIMQGMRDAMKDGDLLLTDKEIQDNYRSLQTKMAAKMKEERQNMAEKNKAEGVAFLEENKKKEGVVTLPSGLQYKVIKEGTGASPKATDVVIAHYRGMLIDGTQFDSSYDRGEPLSIRVDRVIPGWTEALQLMKVGSKWELYIPSELAYGERGGGNVIPPNAALIFEVELLDIKK